MVKSAETVESDAGRSDEGIGNIGFDGFFCLPVRSDVLKSLYSKDTRNDR